uniref:PIN domain-containing protein n=1 Tax=Candidatus Kentrum sp. FW TaxID=2126338 RepID=A0A450SM82_9GAMM|nr:MAG: hypothetical protein BECKFW1821A_GA0114235_105023 [Candidatus Kentron sp. FW]VFJ61135.1 MAG: hypothetical protein BECKFW1821B_GA0114236_106323 [Candidatus Kentron sp. FW]
MLDELKGGVYPNKIVALVSGISPLPLLGDLDRSVEFYVASCVIPEFLTSAAAHLAYASYYDVDYLLTWNCNHHLANANKCRHILPINACLGFSTPEIVTPLQLFKEEKRP